MNIDPRVSAALNGVIAVIGFVVAGGPQIFPSYIPAGVATDIVQTGGFVLGVAGALNAALHLYSSPVAGPLAPPKHLIMLATIFGAALLAVGLSPTGAQARPLQLEASAMHGQQAHTAKRAYHPAPKHVVVRPAPKTAGSINITQLVSGIQAFTAADLQQAAADAAAQTPPDTRHGACWNALIPIVQSGVANPLPSGLGAAQLVQKFFDDRTLVQKGLPDSVVQACALTVYDLTISFNQLAGLVGLKALALPAIP